MYVVSGKKRQLLVEALKLGASERDAARYAGVAKQTARRWRYLLGLPIGRKNRFGRTAWSQRYVERIPSA